MDGSRSSWLGRDILDDSARVIMGGSERPGMIVRDLGKGRVRRP